MSISEKKRIISRSGFREAFKENNPIVPGTAKKLFSLEERMKMEKTLFRKKVGGTALRSQLKKLISRIGRKKSDITDFEKKEIINKKIKILKKIEKDAVSRAQRSKNTKSDFFGKRDFLTRSEFREKLKKASPFTKGFSGLMKEKEREKLEKEIFGKKYGHFIDRKDYARALKDLQKIKARAKTDKEKRKISRNIQFLKDLNSS